MMEMTQLPRMSASEPRKADAPVRQDGDQNASNSDFDQQLNKQIERAEATQKPEEAPAKSVENQQNQSDKQVAAENDVESADDVKPVVAVPVDTELDVDADIVSVVADTEESADPSAKLIDSTVLNPTDKEQILPQQGNQLPPVNEVAKTINAVMTQAATDARPVAEAMIKADRVIPQQTNLTQQVIAAENTATTDEAAEFISAELKQQANAQSNNAPLVTAKTSLNMASAAVAASQLQQVPLTTTASSVNVQPAHIPMTDSSLMPTATTTSTSTLSSTLSTPVQNPAWSQGVAERVAWMVQGNLQSAELKLNPSNLGPLEIKLSVNDDKASVTFITSHAPVREALDAAMPRLRDMLESQGLTLADVDVSDAGVQGEQAEHSSDDGGYSRRANHDGRGSFRGNA